MKKKHGEREFLKTLGWRYSLGRSDDQLYLSDAEFARAQEIITKFTHVSDEDFQKSPIHEAIGKLIESGHYLTLDSQVQLEATALMQFSAMDIAQYETQKGKPVDDAFLERLMIQTLQQVYKGMMKLTTSEYNLGRSSVGFGR